MTDIAPIGRPAAADLTRSGRVNHSASQNAAPARSPDSVELSRHARALSKLAEMPEYRKELVDRVRAEIAAGAYETPDKIDAAIDELASDLS